MIRRVASAIHWIRRDRALSFGLLGGTLTALTGLIGYIVVPVLSGEEQFLIDSAMSAGFQILGRPLWYHVTVLLLPSFTSTLVGTLLVHRSGVTGRRQPVKLLGSIFTLPLGAVFVA